MDLLELWGLARRNWLLLLASLLGGLALAAGYSYIQPVLYSATSTGYVVAGNSATVGDAFAGSNLAAEKAETYLPLVKSQAVAERVADQLGLDSPSGVAGSLEGTVTGSVIFEITATATSPELARDMADAALDATSAEAVALETLTPSGASGGDTVIRIVPVQQADTPTQPVSPNWNRNLALGVMLGLMVGFGVVVLRHSFDRRVRQASDVEEITDSSALGVIPKADELVTSTTLAGDRGAAAEALRQLRTNLRFVSVDKPPRSIVVQRAAQSLMDAMVGDDGVSEPQGMPSSVRGVLDRLVGFRDLYSAGDFPPLESALDVDLFNTYRAALFPTHYPIALQPRSDHRGVFVETVRSHGGQAQTSVSTTKPGITRGEHYHLSKVERFVVLSGTARISLRKVLTDDVVSFDVSGENPVAVDMPTMWVHNIMNTGDSKLTTLFWSHELFNPDASDTYWEPVSISEAVA